MILTNKKQYTSEQDVLRLLDDCRNKDINKIKLNTNNTLEHEMTKCRYCYYLLKQGNRFVTEAIFKDGKGRADILDLTEICAIEVVNTEKEESLIKKANKYPVPILIVRASMLQKK